MSNFDYESYSDGEWEERDELAWNEFDWQRYLKRNEREIARFLSFYEKVKESGGELDEVAHLMGWDTDEWSTTEPDLSDGSDSPGKSGKEDWVNFEDLDPYTIHKHPVSIVTHALYQYLYNQWELCMAQCAPLSSTLAWPYAKSLHRGEVNAIYAIQALDMADYALAICHLKRALNALNRSFSILKELSHATPSQGVFEALQGQAHTRLFDLREVWLRVMRDCREEIRQRFKEGE